MNGTTSLVRCLFAVACAAILVPLGALPALAQTPNDVTFAKTSRRFCSAVVRTAIERMAVPRCR